jgi:prophage DNA circulation protein
MPWQDRLQEAAYVGPDGTRIQFEFVDVRRTVRKKTTAHEFIDAEATYVEDQGLKGDQFPLRVYFSGEDHDIIARAFENLLRQQGPGRLEHPFYGVHNVVPFGDITRNDALVTAANQTIFDVTFWSTILAIFPSADADTLQLVDDAVNSYDEDGALQFENSLEVADVGDRAAFKSDMKALKDGATSALRRAQDGTAKLRIKMARIDDALNSTIDTFVGGPLTMASQMRQLMGAPARSAQLLRSRLDAYGNMARALIAGKGTGAGGGTGISETGVGIVDPGVKSPGSIADANNLFHANRMVAETVVLAVASAVSGEAYTTRQQALDGAFELADLHDSIADWSELNYAVLFEANAGPDSTRPHMTGVGSADTGEARRILLASVTRTLAYLIATSFTLGVERSVVIAVPRSPLDLCYELLGSIDDFEAFMDSNDFTGDEILEIPPGTTVKYYAE